MKKNSIIILIIFLAFNFHVIYANPNQIRNVSLFEPLTQQELVKTIKLIKKSPHYSKDIVFTYLSLQEPQKTDQKYIRQAVALLFNPKQNKSYEVIITLGSKSSLSWKELPQVQLMGSNYDYSTIPELLKSNDAWKSALAKRGIKKPTEVFVSPWIAEPSNDPNLQGHRLFHAIPYDARNNLNDYGRPIEGLSALVDLTTQKIQVLDTGIIPIAKSDSPYNSKSVGPLRTPPNLVHSDQPQGYSFQLKKHQVTWQKWRFNIGFNPRDGLTLHQIQYYDQRKWRSILYRLSLADILVPYGDPDPQWNWRHALDAAEYGLGLVTVPLQKGLDVPENTHLISIPSVNDEGKLEFRKDIIALYEQYGGLSWKHYDLDRTHTNEARRAQNLVVASHVSIGNYDYLIQYIFKQDASMEVVVSLTGIMLPKGIEKNKVDHFAHQVTADIAAPHHQHFFNFRLDFDVDGRENTLVEENTLPMPQGKDNPAGNAFMHQGTVLATSVAARRNLNLDSDRFWIILNPKVKNSLGQPVSYGLIPGSNTIAHAQPNSEVRRMAGFINYHLWATPYDPEQMNATGLYPVLNKHINGLEQWAAENKSIENTDLVVWYTLGVTHIPRPEEWPVMPVTSISFKIVPVGFFTQNPALDLPPLGS